MMRILLHFTIYMLVNVPNTQKHTVWVTKNKCRSLSLSICQTCFNVLSIDFTRMIIVCLYNNISNNNYIVSIYIYIYCIWRGCHWHLSIPLSYGNAILDLRIPFQKHDQDTQGPPVLLTLLWLWCYVVLSVYMNTLEKCAASILRAGVW